MAAQSGSKTVIYAALGGNFLIAAAKFVAEARGHAGDHGRLIKPQTSGTWQRRSGKIAGNE